MERGERTWEDKITITREKVSRKPIVTVEGLWNGKDRLMISRMLHKKMRKARYDVLQSIKRATPEPVQEEPKVTTKDKRIAALIKAREAKKLKKLEEGKNNVRGQK